MSQEEKKDKENEKIKKKRENKISNSPDISQENRLKFIRIKKIPLNKKSNNIINQIENDENDKNKKNDIICQKKKQKTQKASKRITES